MYGGHELGGGVTASTVIRICTSWYDEGDGTWYSEVTTEWYEKCE